MPTAPKKKPAARPKAPAANRARNLPPLAYSGAARRPTKPNGAAAKPKPRAPAGRQLTPAEQKADARLLRSTPGYKGASLPDNETRGSLRKILLGWLPPGTHIHLIRRGDSGTRGHGDTNKVSMVVIAPSKTQRGKVDFSWINGVASGFLNLKFAQFDGHDALVYRAYNARDYLVEMLSRELYGIDNAFTSSFL